jgi:uncharacterized protein
MRVPCPKCGAETDLSAANTNRPFCSERCRNLDLHAWATDQYRIDANAPAVDDEGLQQPSAADNGSGMHN